ncbi:MAG: hypothetical protein HYU66_13825 [Armatimonadetes bacterium]|nr:hypothetical protein [Armatimonadota bacterium]
MIVYHGTTAARARRICEVGLLPRKPSRRVWFAQNRNYAEGRARTQARRTHDRAVVLTCDLDVDQLRRAYGHKRVMHRGGVIAVDGTVPVAVLRSYPALFGQPTSPEDLAAWANELLGLKPWKGVSRRHPGVLRLSEWAVNRLSTQARPELRLTELLDKARQWLPEFFRDVVIDPATLQVWHTVADVAVEAQLPEPPPDDREARALALLDDPEPARRVRGLTQLRRLGDPDLGEWCVMCLADESVDVQVAALTALRDVADADTGVIEPLAGSPLPRVRAAALGTLAALGGPEAAAWVELGLKDPAPCVRMEVVNQLPKLDPVRQQSVFELAVYDPNPEIRRRALRVAGGRRYARMVW